MLFSTVIYITRVSELQLFRKNFTHIFAFAFVSSAIQGQHVGNSAARHVCVAL